MQKKNFAKIFELQIQFIISVTEWIQISFFFQIFHSVHTGFQANSYTNSSRHIRYLAHLCNYRFFRFWWHSCHNFLPIVVAIDKPWTVTVIAPHWLSRLTEFTRSTPRMWFSGTPGHIQSTLARTESSRWRTDSILHVVFVVLVVVIVDVVILSKNSRCARLFNLDYSRVIGES